VETCDETILFCCLFQHLRKYTPFEIVLHVGAPGKQLKLSKFSAGYLRKFPGGFRSAPRILSNTRDAIRKKFEVYTLLWSKMYQTLAEHYFDNRIQGGQVTKVLKNPRQQRCKLFMGVSTGLLKHTEQFSTAAARGLFETFLTWPP
jgi:hypothetical protein